MSGLSVGVAGAPVSFGVFEMTPEGAEVLDADTVLETLQRTGYTGVDLGPVGYLGRGALLRQRLRRHGLELAGGWVELPLTDDAAFEAALPELDDALAVFADAAEAGPARLPRPTLADHGSPARRAAPGTGPDPLDDAGWDRLARNLSRAVQRVRERGLQPTFHHHAGTFVESPSEIGTLLDRVDVGLTFDTGHLLLGGGDPVTCLRRWGSRVDHLHLKDVDTGELRAVVARGGGMVEIWSSGAFTAFGRGDIDLTGVLDTVTAQGFDGWLVVEQDVLPAADVPLAEFRRQREDDHRVNREAVRPWC